MAKAKPTGKKQVTRKKNANGNKWRTLRHKGPQFYPPYKSLGSQLFKYNKKIKKLSKRSEEVAVMYARYLMRRNRPKKLETKIQKNFFEDWRNKYMTASEKKEIVNFSHCDFSGLITHLTKLKEKKKVRSAKEKAKEKQLKENLKDKYQYFFMNGRQEQISNFMVEPPGLYFGRGDNKNIGRIKGRIEPKDVILNCSANCRPRAPAGTHWKSIIHDQTKTWLACWQDPITGKMKYIWPHASSIILSVRDQDKYDKAIELKRRINRIRQKNRNDLSSKSTETSQHATAVYFLDNFALRAGNEKGEGETDTVGCTTLRVEHVKLLPKRKIKFNFHGKDSVPYVREVVVSQQVYSNVSKFIKKKPKKKLIFDQITSKTLNDYLGNMMDGLTAKVFRTFKATECYEEKLTELSRSLRKTDDVREIKLAHFNANLEVAKLLNHVTMTKTSAKSRRKGLQKHSLKIEKVKQKYNLLSRKRPRPGSEEFEEKKGLQAELKINEEELKMKKAKQNFNLGTSLINYIDPRVVKAWCVKFDLDIKHVYSKTQRNKFRWALETARGRR